MEGIIELHYRKVITINTSGAWEKLVFEDSFTEFKLQAQNFTVGTAYTSYAQLQRHVPQAAQLSARVTPAVNGYVKQLDGLIPDVLNNIGKRFLRFDQYQFELINSDITDKAKHQVAVNFYSRRLRWYKTIANLLLVSEMDEDAGAKQTNLFALPLYVNIKSFQPFEA
ncbi:hypothetical protein MUY27_19880 [Mucilaginibacter sp. RS28]|uniref:Uncharacterized protein n=1 Tax=Mucilaginibacter straminoryzae TaxID=2932774 RepID=A0A9X1X6W0_9SPHI|nr:hypothetical protein [Mucilaginibacter straminoryzae]MCJ8211988.1 hypothetical protein [Mucilaginibacter straminoryzae]